MDKMIVSLTGNAPFWVKSYKMWVPADIKVMKKELPATLRFLGMASQRARYDVYTNCSLIIIGSMAVQNRSLPMHLKSRRRSRINQKIYTLSY